MSGHSHFKSIKHQKDIADAKRGKVFSKMARVITIMAKEKGGDPEANAKLKIAIEQAKSFNMPRENIDRAIQKGTGALAGENLEEVIFEAYGPGGIAIIIEGIADNKNRALGDIKQILNQCNGKLAGEGSVRWMFERKGVITIDSKLQNTNFNNKENLELEAIEAGAEDISWDNDILDIYTKVENLETTKKTLETKGLKIDSVKPAWIAKETIEVHEKEKESCQKLFEALDENDTVQDIYSNLRM
jgi:YebC/PmpR family DNA-binding regulatory protein